MARCSLASPPRYTRRLLSSLAALLGLTVPGACSFQETTSSSRLSATPPLGGTVQHVYWGGDVGLTLRYAMDRFPARVPGARVELLAIPNDQVLEKLQLLVAAGTPPDTAQINPRIITPLISKGILADISRYAQRDEQEFRRDDFFPAALERLVKGGRLFGAPVQMGLFVMIFNQDALAAGGEMPPDDSWVWDRYAAVARRLTQGEADAKRFGTLVPPWEILVWAYGGEILDRSEKVCLLNDPKAQSGLQWLQDLRYKYQAAPLPGETALTGQQLFLAGRLAMHIVIPGFVDDIEKAAPPFRWDLTHVPKGPARRATIIQGPSSACIAQSKQPDLAWEWLKWWTGIEVRRYAAREDAAVGARRSSAADYLQRPPPPANRRVLIDSADFARNQPYIAQYDAMSKIINAEWDAALAQNTKSVKEATESAKRQIDVLLAGS
jgi:multiple sugar transport system substrate-binding protein